MRTNAMHLLQYKFPILYTYGLQINGDKLRECVNIVVSEVSYVPQQLLDEQLFYDCLSFMSFENSKAGDHPPTSHSFQSNKMLNLSTLWVVPMAFMNGSGGAVPLCELQYQSCHWLILQPLCVGFLISKCKFILLSLFITYYFLFLFFPFKYAHRFHNSLTLSQY